MLMYDKNWRLSEKAIQNGLKTKPYSKQSRTITSHSGAHIVFALNTVGVYLKSEKVIREHCGGALEIRGH